MVDSNSLMEGADIPQQSLENPEAAPILKKIEDTNHGGAVQTNNPPQRVMVHLMLSLFLLFSAAAISRTVSPDLLLRTAGDDASLAAEFSGVLASIQAVIVIFMSPFLGAMSDAVGRKPIILFTTISQIFGFLAIAMFPFSFVAQGFSIILSSFLTCYGVIVSTVIADIPYERPADLTKNYGYYGAVTGLCFVVAPVFGGYIEGTFFTASSLYVASVLTAFSAVYAYYLVPETRLVPQGSVLPTAIASQAGENDHSPSMMQSLTQVIRNTEANPLPRIREFARQSDAMKWLGLVIGMFTIVVVAFESILYLYVNTVVGWGVQEYSWYLSAAGLVMLVSQGVVIGPVVNNIGERWTMMSGLAVNILVMIVFCVARSSVMLYFGLAMQLLAFTVGPVYQGVLARQTTVDKQGSLQGSMAAVQEVVKPFSPLIGSLVFSVGNEIGFPGLPFVVLALISTATVECARRALWNDQIVM